MTRGEGDGVMVPTAGHYQSICCSALRVKTLIKVEGQEVMTPRPASLNITFRSSDQIYIVCLPRGGK